MVKGWKRVCACVMTAVLLVNACPVAALASVLDRSPGENQAILSQLESIVGSEDEAERYYALLQQYGLLDQDGRAVDEWSIELDGEQVDLAKIREMLGGDYDASKTVTVDGTPVTLGDLDTMLQIEDYIAYLRETYFSDGEWTQEQIDALNSLRAQINESGIQMMGSGEAASFPSGVDHSALITVDAPETAAINSDYTVTLRLASAQSVPVKVDWAAHAGSVGVTGDASGTVVIEAGQTEGTATVRVGDKTGAYLSGDGAFVISFFNARNASLSSENKAAVAVNHTVRVKCNEETVYRTDATATGSREEMWGYKDDAYSQYNEGTFGKDSYDIVDSFSNMSPDYTPFMSATATVDQELAEGNYAGKFRGELTFTASPFKYKDMTYHSSKGYYEIYLNGETLSNSAYLEQDVTKITESLTWTETREEAIENLSKEGAYPFAMYFYIPWIGAEGSNKHEIRAPKVEAKMTISLWETTESATAELVKASGEYVPGQVVPLVAEFSYPMQISKDMTLSLNGGKTKLHPVEEGAISTRATFLYQVSSEDGASLAFTETEDLAALEFSGKGANNLDVKVASPAKDNVDAALKDVKLLTPDRRDAVTGVSASISNPLVDPELNVTVSLSSNEKLTSWLLSEMNDNADQDAGIMTSTSLSVSIDGSTKVPLTAPIEGEFTQLSASIPLDLNTTGAAKSYTAELYLNDEVMLGRYASASLDPAVFVEQDDLSVSTKVLAKDGGEYKYADDTKTIYLQDEPTVSASYALSEGKNYSFAGADQFTWESSDPSIANIDAQGRITPTGKAGSVSFTVTASNGGVEGRQVTATTEALNFGVGLTPFLSIPNNSLVFSAAQDAMVYWTSNLCDKNGDTQTEFKVTVTRDGAKEPAWTSTVTGTGKTPAASVTIPGDVLAYDYSSGANNTFTVEVSSTFEGKEYKDAATIALTPRPATVKFNKLPAYYITDAAGAVNISWQIENFDRYSNSSAKAKDGAESELFEFQILKDGQTDPVATVKDPGASQGEGGGSYAGSFALDNINVEANPTDPTSYRDVYTVTVQAKNGSDSTWSYDSFVLYVYDADALQIMVDGQVADGTLVMSNREAFSKMSQEDILDLKRDIHLKNVISANYGEYAWAEVADQISWALSTKDAATLNYQQGTLYEDIDNFSYTSYRPTEDFVLSGLADGDTQLTATHALTGMSDSLPVKVETMRDRLYLFQCYPQAETKLTFKKYTDAEKTKTEDVTIKSDVTGAAAYYAEFGIASNVWCESIGTDGHTYLGTFYLSDLETGERDSTQMELYPCNNLELRRAAYAYLYLKNPDGTPYTGEIVFRGGVYVNDEYREDALFQLGASASGRAVNTPGNQDTRVSLGKDGKLEVTMDQTQWNLDGGAVGADDKVRYVFQIERADGTDYLPIIQVVDAGVSEEAWVSSGEAIATFRDNDSKDEHPFIASQVGNYSNYGTLTSLIGATGNVGPSDSCPEAYITTAVMWWGDKKPEDPSKAANKIALMTEDSVPVADGSGEFEIENTSYEFSDELITQYTVRLDKQTMEGLLDAGKAVGLRLDYLADGTSLSRSESLSFSLCNMLGMGRVEEQKSVSDLIANLGSFTQTNATNPEGMSQGDQFVNTLLTLVAEDSYTTEESGSFSIKLAPTSDPTKFMGFVKVGAGKMLSGEAISGVYMNPNKDEYSSVKPGLSETMLLAGMKSPMEYKKEQLEKLDNALKSKKNSDKHFGLGGYAEALVYFDQDSAAWRIRILDGGFDAGGGMSYSWNFNTFCGPIPFTATLTAGGTAQVSLDMLTVAYMNKDTGYQGLGNDYLTQLRLYLYLRFFAGVGFDYSIVAFKLGVYGQVNFDNSFHWLNRPYIEAGEQNTVDGGTDDVLDGQNFKINGQVGLEFIMKLLFINYDKILYSYNFELLDETTGDWNTIQSNWAANSAALKDAVGDLVANGSASLLDAGGGMQMLSLNLAPTLEDRSYLEDEAAGAREWGEGFKLFALDENNGLANLESNTYPYANPVVTQDGELVAYLTDSGSTDVADTHVAYATKSGDSYTKGSVLPDPASGDGSSDDESGYGDGQLSLAGTGDFAVAAWSRQMKEVDRDPDPETGEVVLTDDDQMMMLNSSEAFASVWTGRDWATTRLSNNGGADLAPVVATNGKSGSDARAIVAWRSVASSGAADPQSEYASNPANFDMENMIVYRVYKDGTWSEEQTLYNGTSGAVKGISAHMLADGTAAISYSLDKDGSETTSTDREVAYAVISADGDADGGARMVEATNDDYLDENPQLTSVTFPGDAGERFVLGWYSERPADVASTADATASQELEPDIRLIDFDATGAAGQMLPDSLAKVSSSYGVSVTSTFRFAKGSESIDDLMILWAERAETAAGAADDETAGTAGDAASVTGANTYDVLKAAKFYRDGDEVRFTGALDVAQMDQGTLIDHFDAYTEPGESAGVRAVILATQYGKDGATQTRVARTVGGDVVSFETPARTSAMYTASAVFENAIDVPAVVPDYETVHVGSSTQLRFHIDNEGIRPIESVTIKVGDSETTFDDLSLMPGEGTDLTADYAVGDTVEDPAYTVSATFDDGGEQGLFSGIARMLGADPNTVSVEGTVYLDRPDLQVASAQITREEEGKRDIVVKLVNTSDATLAGHEGRSVRLGFYTDATCATPLEGIGEGGYVTIDNADDLAMIDDGGYAKLFTFDVNDYLAKRDLTEIPDTGIEVYVKADVMETDEGEQIVYAEPDLSNNQANVVVDNLRVRTGKDVSLSYDLSSTDDGASVTVDMRNNNLAKTTTGNLVVTLLNARGEIVGQQQTYKPDDDSGFVTLDGEGADQQSFSFKGVSDAVRAEVTYSNAVLDVNNADLELVQVQGVSLGYADGGEAPEGEEPIEIAGTYSGSASDLSESLVTIHAANPKATIEIDGTTYTGTAAFTHYFSSGDNRIEIKVTSQDGTATKTYVLLIHNDVAYVPPSYEVAVDQDTSHGTVKVQPAWAQGGQKVTITASPDEGYTVGSVEVTDKDGAALEVVDNGDGTWTFTMPYGKVSVRVVFTCDGGELCPSRDYVDVPVGTWYHDVIDWAVTEGVLNGYGDGSGRMGPEDTVTRVQVAAILSNLEGAEAGDLSVLDDFVDVDKGAWYAGSLAWAVEEGLLSGYGDGSHRMDPNGALTREQASAVLMRWSERAGDDVSLAGDLSSFPDVDSVSPWAKDCLAWAVGSDVLHGVAQPDGSRLLDPQGLCTRAQMAALMMNRQQAKEREAI